MRAAGRSGRKIRSPARSGNGVYHSLREHAVGAEDGASLNQPMPKPSGSELMERIVALAKRRGFVFPASEIYGGINGFWDYGPLGVQLKNNLRDAWWREMVRVPAARARRPPADHRRSRLLDHPEPARLGGERPRRRVQRPDVRLPRDQAALPRRSDPGARARATAARPRRRSRSSRASTSRRSRPRAR